MTVDYVTFKMIMKFIKSYPIFVPCTIDNGQVVCVNSEIQKHILTNDIKDIKHITFYVLYSTNTSVNEMVNEMVNTIKNLPFDLLPVYHMNEPLKSFLQKYIQFNNIDIHAYDTKHYEKINYQESYLNKESCLKVKPYNTNPEFSHFNQFIFHAGNDYQLYRHGMLLSSTLFNFKETVETDRSHFNYGINAIHNTLSYNFNYLKKGILVGIKNNKLVIFLPFSKANYENDFYEELYFNNRDKEMLKQLKKEPNNKKLSSMLEATTREYFKKFRVTSKDAIWDRRKWYANGCFFRYDTYEGDKLVLVYQDILTELCQNRKLNDCVFVLNVRDFPLLRKDRRHPYSYITDKKIPEKYHGEFCPILSACTSLYYDDVPMITQDDWYRTSKKFYPEGCNNIYTEEIAQVPWQDKKEIAFFRGAASGCGTDSNNNMRIKVIELSKQYPELFNVGLTSFNRRMKKIPNKPVHVIDPKQHERATFVTDSEKIKHKYILNIDGHVTAFRLGNELSTGSVLLIVQSHYYIWISTFIKPFEHYIPISCDLSDLVEKIKWCKENDEKCKIITQNARRVFDKHMNRDGIFNYMQSIVNKMTLIRDIPYVPINYNKANKIGIVLCYRDNTEHTRYKEMIFYKYNLSKMLINAGIDFRIIVVEQSSKDKFNIGTLKNIGYLQLVEKETDIDNIIFSDIDMIPDYNLFPYFYTVINGISMLALNGTRYEVDNNGIFMGGCIACDSKTFKQINGYSNSFIRGWGGEDENLYVRCALENITIYKPMTGMVMDIETDVKGSRKGIMEKLAQEKSDENYDTKKFEQLCKYNLYKEDGLSNMTYDILYEHYSDNVYHVIVDVKHEEHAKLFPNHIDYSDFTMDKYSQYKKFRMNLKPKIVLY